MTLNHLHLRLPLGFILAVFVSFSGSANAENRHLSEVQYFWQSPTELAALNVIRRAFEERGGQWVDFPTESSLDNRYMAFRRIVKGVPPFALQWHAGNDLRALSQSGVIYDLTEVAKAENWSQDLHEKVKLKIRVDDKYFGLPVGVHTQNWAWFNSRLLKRYTQNIPDNWDDVLDVLAQFHADGGVGIAMGRGEWERAHLFSAILVSEGGGQKYRDLMEHADLTALDDPVFRRSFEIFAKLRKYHVRSLVIESWNEATDAVATGKAMVQFMGDWVLPELTIKGLVQGVDFECVLSIGRKKQQIAVVDIMIFPMGEDRSLTEQHQWMIDAVLAPKTQIEFSKLKGSIPVRSGLADQIDDVCTRQSYQLFATQETMPATVMIVNERLEGIFSVVVNQLWEDKTLDAEQAMHELRKRLSVAVDHQK